MSNPIRDGNSNMIHVALCKNLPFETGLAKDFWLLHDFKFFMTFNILHNTSSWLSGMWWGYAMCRRCNTSYTKKLIPIIHFNLINVKISISWKHPSNNVSYKILIMVHLLLPFYGKGCFLRFQFSKLIYVLGILH